MKRLVKVIVPCRDEQRVVGPCLSALVASPMPAGWRLAIDVVANGCRDRSAAVVRRAAAEAGDAGVALRLIEIAEGSKTAALNRALPEGAAVLVHVDADVVVDPSLIGALVAALGGRTPGYASGRVRAVHSGGWAAGCYARVWARLPFARREIPGCGLYAVNAAGRRRWGAFPDVVADDMFVRLLFRPHERREVEAGFAWPVPGTLRELAAVRRRWDFGNRELRRRYPGLGGGGARRRLRDYAGPALAMPVASAVYAGVCLWSRCTLPQARARDGWARASRAGEG
ncbi:glycosyltransferase [Jannaschia sp. W003]|uniref:glycosyltransferase n=1 Tax=Jannaschia sp. W003 TaxID=2867012 RepID=UPI0021A420D0|nr:glycosyltransferase [Jannaschia sp. W003]UWQ21806.1 glycosyltransferase [Jannaschia sp. W003]